MKLFAIHNHGPIIVNSGDTPQPPGDPDGFRNWTLIAGPAKIPPNENGKFAWYATAILEIDSEWTGTPNVEFSWMARAVQPGFGDVVMDFGGGGVSLVKGPMGLSQHAEAVLFSPANIEGAYLEVTLWACQVAGNHPGAHGGKYVPWWPDLGDIGAFTVRNVRMALCFPELSAAARLNEACRQATGFYQLIDPAPQTYFENIQGTKIGTKTISSNDGWTEILRGCEPGNLLSSVPCAAHGTVTVTFQDAVYGSGAAPSDKPNAPAGTRVDVRLTLNGQAVRQWVVRKPLAGPVGVDIPWVLPDLPAGNHMVGMDVKIAPAADGVEQWLSFASCIIWGSGLPTTAAISIFGRRRSDSLIIGSNAWVPIGDPQPAKAGLFTLAFTGLARSATFDPLPFDAVRIGFSIDGASSGDRHPTVQNIGESWPVSICAQEIIEIPNDGKTHTVQPWVRTALGAVEISSWEFAWMPLT